MIKEDTPKARYYAARRRFRAACHRAWIAGCTAAGERIMLTPDYRGIIRRVSQRTGIPAAALTAAPIPAWDRPVSGRILGVQNEARVSHDLAAALREVL